MSNSTQCELCGDSKSNNSMYCIYCQAMNNIKPAETQSTSELSVPIDKKKTQIIIVVILVCILVLLILSSVFDSSYKVFNALKTNMKKFMVLIVGFLLIVIMFYYLIQNRENSDSDKSKTTTTTTGEDIIDSDENIEEIDLLEPEEEERDLGEVFHVSDKSYTYNEARAICKKYGADLATPSQVYKMYLKGTSWCNPGWSEGQHVIFPSTEESVNKANSNEETKGTCGKVGLNGMFEKNISSKFGANCWQGGDDIDSSGI